MNWIENNFNPYVEFVRLRRFLTTPIEFHSAVETTARMALFDVRTRRDFMSVESYLVEAASFQLSEYLHAADAVPRRLSPPRGGYRLQS